MNHSSLLSSPFVSTLLVISIGVSVALVVWLISHALAAIPSDDRSYKDPPPLGFRLVWWPITWVSHIIQPMVTAKAQTRLRARLRKADLEYCLSPLQFTASRLVAGGVLALAALWVMHSFSARHDIEILSYLEVMLIAALGGWMYPVIWLNDRLATRSKELLRSLPFFLDVITLCVEAGLNIQGAINQAVLKCPKGALRDEFQRILRDVRAGSARAKAMRDMAERVQETAVSNFVAAVIQAEQMGMNLGPVLRVQADQRRTERFHRAEKLAMEAPVKMLLPLIGFIFPCTFIVLFFPIAMRFMNSGF